MSNLNLKFKSARNKEINKIVHNLLDYLEMIPVEDSDSELNFNEEDYLSACNNDSSPSSSACDEFLRMDVNDIDTGDFSPQSSEKSPSSASSRAAVSDLSTPASALSAPAADSGIMVQINVIKSPKEERAPCWNYFKKVKKSASCM